MCEGIFTHLLLLHACMPVPQRSVGLMRAEVERLRAGRHDQAYGMADAAARGDALSSCVGRLVDTMASVVALPPELARGLKVGTRHTLPCPAMLGSVA